MLKNKRIEKGWSQSDLANKSGVNLPMIQFYEQGFRNIDHARLETLCKLAKALDCPISSILNKEELIEQCKAVEL